MSKQRRQFDAACKLEAARMVKDQGMSVSQVCQRLNPGETAVRRWTRRYAAERAGNPNLGLPLMAEQQRIRLRPDNE